MTFTLREAPTPETRLDHNPRNYMPSAPCDKCVGSLTSPVNHVHVTLKMQVTEPVVCSPIYLQM